MLHKFMFCVNTFKIQSKVAMNKTHIFIYIYIYIYFNDRMCLIYFSRLFRNSMEFGIYEIVTFNAVVENNGSAF